MENWKIRLRDWAEEYGIEDMFEWDNLEGMRKLDLYKTGIREIPPEIGNLTNLRRLDLLRNDIKELPFEITYLDLDYLNNYFKKQNETTEQLIKRRDYTIAPKQKPQPKQEIVVTPKNLKNKSPNRSPSLL